MKHTYPYSDYIWHSTSHKCSQTTATISGPSLFLDELRLPYTRVQALFCYVGDGFVLKGLISVIFVLLCFRTHFCAGYSLISAIAVTTCNTSSALSRTSQLTSCRRFCKTGPTWSMVEPFIVFIRRAKFGGMKFWMATCINLSPCTDSWNRANSRWTYLHTYLITYSLHGAGSYLRR